MGRQSRKTRRKHPRARRGRSRAPRRRSTTKRRGGNPREFTEKPEEFLENPEIENWLEEYLQNLRNICSIIETNKKFLDCDHELYRELQDFLNQELTLTKSEFLEKMNLTSLLFEDSPDLMAKDENKHFITPRFNASTILCNDLRHEIHRNLEYLYELMYVIHTQYFVQKRAFEQDRIAKQRSIKNPFSVDDDDAFIDEDNDEPPRKFAKTDSA
jgi:hypothetical protein